MLNYISLTLLRRQAVTDVQIFCLSFLVCFNLIIPALSHTTAFLNMVYFSYVLLAFTGVIYNCK